MPLSANELSAAKKAYCEIRDFRATRFLIVGWSCLFGLSLFSFGISVMSSVSVLIDEKFLKNHSSVFVPLILIIGLLIRYRTLRTRYVESLKVVTDLENAHARELPFGLENEVAKLTAAEKKPFLWRLDAFLSRKPQV